MLNNRLHLEKREKIVLLVGIIIVLIAVLYYALYSPYHDVVSRLDKKIAAKEMQLGEVRGLQAEYQALQRQLKRSQRTLRKQGSLSPLAKVEEMTSQIVSREKLSYIRPQPSQTQGELRVDSLDIKLEKLSLEQILQLLWTVESPASRMQVKNLRIKKRFDDASQLDVTLTISIFGQHSS